MKHNEPMDTPRQEEEEEVLIEESISQVSETAAKKQMPIWMLGVVVAFVVIVAMSFGGESEDGKKSSDIAFSEQPYEVQKTPPPAMPQKAVPPKPERPVEIVDPLPEIAAVEPSLSPEEKAAAKKAQELADRRQRAPLVLVNKRDKDGGEGNSDVRKEASRRMAELQRNTQEALQTMVQAGETEDESMNALSTGSVEVVEAGYVTDKSYKLLQGKVIPAVLESAINSDLPGMLRAVVSEAVYSEDGNVLIIPKGSRLIGEYSSGVKRGQSRIFVIWSRMVRPDGIDIKMDSPGTDSLGRSGMTGFVDTHFMERFGASALLSLIGGYAQSESENDNQREAVASSFNKSSEIALEDSINIPPTIHINQGELINVFVAKDLNFKKAIQYAQRSNKFSHGK